MRGYLSVRMLIKCEKLKEIMTKKELQEEVRFAVEQLSPLWAVLRDNRASKQQIYESYSTPSKFIVDPSVLRGAFATLLISEEISREDLERLGSAVTFGRPSIAIGMYQLLEDSYCDYLKAKKQ